MANWLTVAGTWAELCAHHSYVVGVVALAPISSEARAGARTRLAVTATYLDRLSISGDVTAALNVSGEASRWVAIANTQGEALNDILRDVSAENVFSRLWTEVVLPTGSTVVQKVNDVGFGAGVGLGAVLGLAALFLVWKASR